MHARHDDGLVKLGDFVQCFRGVARDNFQNLELCNDARLGTQLWNAMHNGSMKHFRCYRAGYISAQP